MSIVLPTLNQIAFLFGFITIGYIIMKLGVIPKNAAESLSKLENVIFIPALVMGTFIDNFTVERIRSAWKLLAVSFLIAFVAIPVAILISRLVTKDKYIQKIYTYGLSFSNFGFMGNAVVSSLFPEIFFEYLIFTVPLWTLIYLWGVPRLLIADPNKKQSIIENLKSFINPMFIGMFIGMLIGILNIKLPVFLTTIISVSGDCMSPIAMLLTGMVVSAVSLKQIFFNYRIYIISLIRLLVFPLVFVLLSNYINLPRTIYLCALCSLAMPLGLNTIVIPSAYGKDTTVASGMTVISHMMSCITIPFVFMLSNLCNC
ncbi:MAG: AEC family transporter [Clostridia bacterium]|nr:AEC family transporter [Clostridia bacterium]